jgi:hypothetical protein
MIASATSLLSTACFNQGAFRAEAPLLMPSVQRIRKQFLGSLETSLPNKTKPSHSLAPACAVIQLL